MIILLMGVSGCGKTTVGKKLAAQLGWSFHDADDFHPAANIAKMTAGVPLDDADRASWLASIRDHIDRCRAKGVPAVVTCSALKQKYRAVLLNNAPQVRLVHLAGSFHLIHQRLLARSDHFMKPEMLRSQFDALEVPLDATIVDVIDSPDAIATEIRKKLRLTPEENSPGRRSGTSDLSADDSMSDHVQA